MMKRLLLIGLVFVAGAMPADARIINAWSCDIITSQGIPDKIEVQLHKHAVHYSSLVFTGPLVVWSPSGKRATGVKFEYIGRDGAILNGKRCETLPYDPKWDEEDQ